MNILSQLEEQADYYDLQAMNTLVESLSSAQLEENKQEIIRIYDMVYRSGMYDLDCDTINAILGRFPYCIFRAGLRLPIVLHQPPCRRKTATGQRTGAGIPGTSSLFATLFLHGKTRDKIRRQRKMCCPVAAMQSSHPVKRVRCL
jgi:hypothetical protein